MATRCYTLEVEYINLKTGARDWQPAPDAPASACPSCCEPAGKVLRRVVLQRDTCTVPFTDGNGRTWRKRTEMQTADGTCGTLTNYAYDLPCSDPMKLVNLNRAVLYGQCKASIKFETATGTVYQFEVRELTQQVSLPLGSLRVTLTATDCGGDLKLMNLGTGNAIGSQVHISRQPPASVVINELTYGFYVDLL